MKSRPKGIAVVSATLDSSDQRVEVDIPGMEPQSQYVMSQVVMGLVGTPAISNQAMISGAINAFGVLIGTLGARSGAAVSYNMEMAEQGLVLDKISTLIEPIVSSNYHRAHDSRTATDGSTFSSMNRPLVAVSYVGLDRSDLSCPLRQGLDDLLVVGQEFVRGRSETVARICISWYDASDRRDISVAFLIPSLEAEQAMEYWAELDGYIQNKSEFLSADRSSVIADHIVTKVRWSADASRV